MIELIIAIILGCIAGTITGLIPGIHINLVSTITISLSALLLKISDPITIGAFIISMSILHTFMNAIPAIFLGAPEESTALAVLPGHRLLLKGRGYDAVKLTIIGSLLGLLVISISVPLLIAVIPKFYNFIKDYIAYILIGSSSFLILRDKNKRFFSLFMFLLSGVFGLCVFNINMRQPLFPMLSGLFGISNLILSYKDKVKIPDQTLFTSIIKKSQIIKSIFSGLFASVLCGFLPGLGSAQVAILGTSLFKKWTSESFLILVGSIDTIMMFISIVGLYTIQKARSGSVIVLSKLIEKFTLNDLIFYLGVALIVGGIATILTIIIAKYATKVMNKINYQKTCLIIIISIIILSFILSGFIGLFVLMISTLIGILAPLKGVNRSHLMGCLIVPVILFFLL